MYSEKIILLHAKSYEIYDENSREYKRGLTLIFLNKGTLIPVSDNVNGIYEGGYKPAKASVSLDMLGKVQNVPAVYDASFDISVTSSGKTELKLQDISYVKDLDSSVLTPPNSPSKAEK